MGKARPDSGFLHAGQPQAGKGLFAPGLLVHQAEDQFSLAPGIATVHDAIHIRAVHQLLQDAELLFGASRHQILPLLRQDGQVCDAPLDVLGIVDIGWSQFYQMPDAQLYPDKMTGFVSIDSAPLQRSYVTAVEIWLLKRMEPVYAHYPWKWLLKSGSEGVATSDYGRNLMREIMLTYDGNQKRYAQIAGHGFRILAAAMEKDLPYEIKCPVLLICGTQDHAGSCIRYNKAWHRNTKIPLTWIEGAGHNSNTDRPEQVNRLIEEFVADIL